MVYGLRGGKMLEHLIYLLPLLVLLGGIIFYALVNFKQDETSKCFRFSRILLVSGLALNVIFYNKPMIAEITSANRLTASFIVLLYIEALVIVYAARKWFSNMKQSGGQFCYMLLLGVLAGSLLIVSKNLALTTAAIILFVWGNYGMLQKTDNSKQTVETNRLYLGVATTCITLFVVALILVYKFCQSFDYVDIALYLANSPHTATVFAIGAILVLGYMFLFAAAPLHYWLTEVSGKMTMPVFAYFMLIPNIAYLLSFIRLNLRVLQPLNSELQLFYVGVAFMSMFVGAVGTCSSQNIRKIFAYISVYYIGNVFLVLQHTTPVAAQAVIIYWIVYLLAMTGLCLTLFSLKARGEHLLVLNEFSGVVYKCPLVAITMIFFMFSLLGFPPFTGALGLFAILNNLAAQNHFYCLLYVLLTLMMTGYAYLHIIRTLYFEDSRNNFDRADFGLSCLLVILTGLMIYLVLQPQYLLAQTWLFEVL
jgi:NADH-quinone oxidoreductase subunit N